MTAPAAPVGGFDLVDECEGLAITPERPTCLHVLAHEFLIDNFAVISTRTLCPACLRTHGEALAALPLDPPIRWGRSA